jgi:phospholipase A1
MQFSAVAWGLAGSLIFSAAAAGQVAPAWQVTQYLDTQSDVKFVGPGQTTTAPATATPPAPLEAGPQSPPATIPSSAKPESSSAEAGQFPAIAGSFGLDEFVQHFAPHEPMYFIGGWEAPNIKFQFSLRYRFFTPNGPLATKYPVFKGFNFAYSQTSFWDVSNPSQPFFFDSSYRPEVFYYLENVPNLPEGWQLGVQAGAGHESNGKQPPTHRSLNIAYIRPIFSISDPHSDLFLTFAPKFYDYIGGLTLNPDMPTYRGYCDIRVVTGQRDGLELAAIGRIGSHWNRGSVQLDLTYPLTKVFHGNTDLCLDVQYFNGYGDSLLTYNKSSNVLRFGVALTR